jgi:hypothetical protein
MSSELLSVVFRVGLAALAALAIVPIEPLGAQSYLQSLFGDDAPAAPNPAAGYVRRQSPGVSPYSPPSRPFSLFSPYQSYDYQDQLAPDRTTFRTLCVRMCDGFYFPISYATNSAAFTYDAEKCAAACGGDARLFYHANPGGDVGDMVDLTGRAYASYAIAFRYRKTLVKGCQCRPHPWSEAERARHRAYAAARMPAAGPLGLGAPTVEVPFASGADDDDANDPTASPPLDRNALESPAPHPVVLPKSNPPPMARPTPVSKHVQEEQWSWFSGDAANNPRKPSHTWPGGR